MPTTAVLFSGGLDSAVLLASEMRAGNVVPIYVRAGFAWEAAEARAIARLLAAPLFVDRVRPMISIGVDMSDVYPSTHWALAGIPPSYDTPDEAVYLEGRNIMLASKAAVLCARLNISRLALGPLAGNPFPDATREFFAAMSHALSMGLMHRIELVAPLAQMSKREVIQLGLELGVPLELTMSCMNPQTIDSEADRACGQCSKCRERDQAFSSL